MKKLLYLLFCLPFLFSACNSDDDSSIGFYIPDDHSYAISETSIYLHVSEYRLEVKGGSGDYTYNTKGDIDAITLGSSYENGRRFITIMPQKEGSLQLIATDAKGNYAILPVTITRQSRKGHIFETLLEINVADEAIKTAIEEDAKADFQLLKDYGLTFISGNSSDSGDLIIFPDKNNENVKYEGLFTITNSADGRFMNITFDNKTHEYRFGGDWTYQKRMPYPSNINVLLTEDLTEKYQTKYPTANIESVKYKLHLID